MSVSGKFFTVKNNNSAIGGVYSVSIQDSVEELAKDSGATAGYGDRDGGLKDIVVTIRGWIDLGATAFSGVQSGDLVSNLTVPLGASSSNNILTMGNGLVLGFNVTGETRGRLEFESTVKNKGSYTVSSSV